MKGGDCSPYPLTLDATNKPLKFKRSPIIFLNIPICKHIVESLWDSVAVCVSLADVWMEAR